MGRHLQSKTRGAAAVTVVVWLTFLTVNVLFWRYTGALLSAKLAWSEQKAFAGGDPCSATYNLCDGSCDIGEDCQLDMITNQDCVCVTHTPTATPTDTPTATPTDTPTVTPTNTPAQDGAPCTGPVDCISVKCVDDVCCNDACTGADQICNLQGSVGTCTDITAAAPAASRTGLLIGLGVLTAIAAIALWRRRELTHYLWSV